MKIPRLTKFQSYIAAMLFSISTMFFAAYACANESDLALVIKGAQNNPRQTAASALQRLSEAQKRGDKSAQLRALQVLYEAYGVTEEASAHPDGIEQGLMLSKELGNQAALCDFLIHKAWIEWNSDHRDDAIRALDDAQLLAATHELRERLAWVYANEGMMFSASGRESDSAEAQSKAYAIFSDLHDTYGIAYTMFMFGTGHRGSVEEDQIAEGYFKRAATTVDLNVYRKFAATLNLYLGTTFNDKQENGRRDYEQAKHYFTTSLSILQALDLPKSAAYVEMQLGRLELNNKQYAAANVHYEAALAGLLANNNGRQIYANTLLERAKTLAYLKRDKECLDSLSAAHDMQKTLKNQQFDVFFYKNAAEIYAQLGDYADAYESMARHAEAEAILAKTNDDKLNTELKMRFDVRLKDTENALLKAQVSQERSRNLIILLSVALILLLLSGIIFIMRRRTLEAKKESRHHQELAALETSANHAKSAFLARMSHELRSPLNAIIGFARLLLRDPAQTGQGKENLAIILKSGEHLHALINEVLDLSKIEAGRVVLMERDVDVHELMDGIEEMFALSAADKGLQLNICIDATVPRFIRADAVRLRQILINLICNAIKFTDEGSVDLQLCKASCDDAPDEQMIGAPCKLEFVVSDTGVGIAEDEVSHLGSPFVQAREGQERGDGTGLGLAISRSFIELMGGTFKISSHVSKGTRVEFTLAVHVAKSDSIISIQNNGAARRDSLCSGQQQYRILIVDDLEDGRRLLTQMLAPLGFELSEACNGAEAIALWQTWNPDLIIMDRRMPVLDGHEAVQRIRAMPGGDKPIIIGLTADQIEPAHASGLTNGFNDYLSKPLNDFTLFALLHKHLNVKFVSGDLLKSHLPQLEMLQWQAVPNALLGQLQQALAVLDVAAVSGIIDRIRDRDVGLADRLHEFARNFQFEAILESMAKAELAEKMPDEALTNRPVHVTEQEIAS